jgi:hypothetical protein
VIVRDEDGEVADSPPDELAGASSEQVEQLFAAGVAAEAVVEHQGKRSCGLHAVLSVGAALPRWPQREHGAVGRLPGGRAVDEGRAVAPLGQEGSGSRNPQVHALVGGVEKGGCVLRVERGVR